MLFCEGSPAQQIASGPARPPTHCLPFLGDVGDRVQGVIPTPAVLAKEVMGLPTRRVRCLLFFVGDAIPEAERLSFVRTEALSFPRRCSTSPIRQKLCLPAHVPNAVSAGGSSRSHFPRSGWARTSQPLALEDCRGLHPSGTSSRLPAMSECRASLLAVRGWTGGDDAARAWEGLRRYGFFTPQTLRGGWSMTEHEREERALRDTVTFLQGELRRGKLSRREFLARATAAGLSLAVAESLAGCAQPAPTAAPPTSAPVVAATSAPPTTVPPTTVPPTQPPKPTAVPQQPATEGWGMEHYPYPKGQAFIEADEMKCQGCGICQMACSMFHFGVINKDLARIQVHHYLLPLPKSVQVTCCQCPDEERACTKACPLTPPAIDFDKKLLHMTVDAQRCLGEKCNQCGEACPAHAIRFYTPVTKEALVCDLCEKDGVRKPSCVDVCPSNALYFKWETPVDNWRRDGETKADLIARRLYPLTKVDMAKPGWRS